MNTRKKILVVGGGTAGFITALILNKHLDIDIDVVHSKNIGIIGVGEGSTEHFKEFCNFIGIDYPTIIKECDATFKSGIMFENWGPKDYLHNVSADFRQTIAQHHLVYEKLIAENDPHLYFQCTKRNELPSGFLNDTNVWPYFQFHFNTHKLNDFLAKIAKDRGINVFEDDLSDTVIDCEGNIVEVLGNETSYKYDFYIDATGFKRLLISKLGAKWQSYSKYLKMKAAIVFPTGDRENYNLWTLARAMDYGWLFQIPVWGRHGNGYIYDSDYITKEQAKQEVEKFLGHDIDVAKEFKFDPGCLDRVWINNCCAVGLCGSFVEPLEASSIGTTIQQSFLLMHRFPNYSQKTIEDYNKSFNNIMENVRDFIALHYCTDKNNSQFWKDVRNIELPYTLQTNLEKWKHKLPIVEDFRESSQYILFGPANHILVMEGLELFDRKSIAKEYAQLSTNYRNMINEYFQQVIEPNQNRTDLISHKKFIEIIRGTVQVTMPPLPVQA